MENISTEDSRGYGENYIYYLTFFVSTDNARTKGSEGAIGNNYIIYINNACSSYYYYYDNRLKKRYEVWTSCKRFSSARRFVYGENVIEIIKSK